jgi:hypothetical protein
MRCLGDVGMQAYSSKEIDVFRPCQYGREPTESMKQSSFDQRRLQWDPLTRHGGKKAVSVKSVMKADQVLSITLDQLGFAIQPGRVSLMGQAPQMGPCVLPQPVIVIQEVKIPPRGDGGTRVPGHASFAAVGVDHTHSR